MKLITVCSFKGGSGKTTCLMALCSALNSRGARVALIEADENRPLTRWKENSETNGTWDKNTEIFIADELEALELAYGQAESGNFDFALADTHGGTSELNNIIVVNSNFLILPTMLTALDVDEVLATYRYVMEVMISEQVQIPTAILKQRVPVSRLTMSQKSSNDLLSELPCFEEPMHERDAFASLKRKGLLNKTIENMQSNPAQRLQLNNYLRAWREAEQVCDFVLDNV